VACPVLQQDKGAFLAADSQRLADSSAAGSIRRDLCLRHGLSGSYHHWWDCPVAKTVICDMQRQMNAYAAAVNKPIQQLSALNVWLAEVPDGVKPWLWQTVCMAAVAAMDHGRNVLAAQAREAAVSGSIMLRNASNNAVAHFWSLLEEAAASRRLPASPAAVAVQLFFRFCGYWTVARAP